MLVINGFFENGVFVPEKPLTDIKGRQKAVLSIEQNEKTNEKLSKKQEKLTAFQQLIKAVNETNQTDPLPPKFDEILSQRVQFRELTCL